MISPQELRQLGLFKDASANAVARLATALREKTCAPGEVILKEGDENIGLHLIASGEVGIYKHIDKSHKKHLAQLSRGEFFGEMSLIDHQPASAEVVAETATRLFVLTRSDFQFLMSKAPTEALDHLSTLLSSVSSRLRQTTRELVTLFEVARDIGTFGSATQLGEAVLNVLSGMFGEFTTIGFFRWNPFNDEYARCVTAGPKALLLPDVLIPPAPKDSVDPIVSYPDTRQKNAFGIMLPAGHLVVSRSDHGQKREALFLYFTESPRAFESGDRQLMETVSAVLAPAFENARVREEEEALRRYNENRQKFAS